jgi:hypothetical protein
MSVGVESKKDSINKDGLTNSGVSDKEDLRSVLKKRLDNKSVSYSVNSWNINVMELLDDWFPVSLEFFFPRSEFLLLLVDLMLENCVGMREH